MRKIFIGLGLVAVLSLGLGIFYQQHQRGVSPRCHLCGNRIQALYQVEIVLNNQEKKPFCSVVCGEKWFGPNKKNVSYVAVTDEVSGKRIDANLANFLQNDIVTDLASGNNIHVFAEWFELLGYYKRYGGEIVKDPFDLND